MTSPPQPHDNYTAHYISGTHWDREWYRPFQEFRVLLVELVDALLDLMEQNPDFQYFHLDGQTCILQDYLEVRPENQPRLQKLIAEGRILIGPWFTMPDLFGPGAEALVRNLLMGRRIARQWGVEPMSVAYTCDMFGHPSQMPQIYRGFGLAHCVLGRGTNEHTTPTFFNWHAPDGSTVFVFKLQDRDGYGSFVRIRAALAQAQANHDPQAQTDALEKLRQYVQYETDRANGRALCIIDALDHEFPAADAAQYLEILTKTCPNVAGQHSTLPAFFAHAEKTAFDLPTRYGELREPARGVGGYLWLIANCSSGRVRVKQANDSCQTLLERWTEPFLTIANLENAGIPENFLNLAWQHLLLCHAHDSICGCSIDQVHRDMMYRFDQVRLLSQQLRYKAFAALTGPCADLATQPHEFTLTIANPTLRPRREVVTFDIDLPPDYPTTFCDGFFGQQIKSFTLTDLHGREVPYQRLALQLNTINRSTVVLPAFTGDPACDRYTVAAELDLPALGFTSLLVKPSLSPVRRMTTLRRGPNTAENEHLSVTVADNGTITLTDKATSQQYRDLLVFEDRCETGDGWFHVDPINDEIALSTAASAQVSIVNDGPEVVTFRIAVTMNVPARFDLHSQRRSQSRVDLSIVTLVTLRRGARVLDLETRVENNAEDHLLRLLLPTDVQADTFLSHHPFDLVERPIALDQNTADWKEAEVAEKPFLSLQAVGGSGRGLAFISAAGLHEGGVLDDDRRTMQVTLLRSFRFTVGTSGEPDGLELGSHRFRYQLMPFATELPRVQALEQLVRLQGGIITRQTGQFSSGYPEMTGSAPPERSFIELKGAHLIVSAVKPRAIGGGMVLRLWNPTDQPCTETISFHRTVRQAQYLQLSEEPITDRHPTVAGNDVTVSAQPHQIVTLALDLS